MLGQPRAACKKALSGVPAPGVPAPVLNFVATSTSMLCFEQLRMRNSLFLTERALISTMLFNAVLTAFTIARRSENLAFVGALVTMEINNHCSYYPP